MLRSNDWCGQAMVRSMISFQCRKSKRILSLICDGTMQFDLYGVLLPACSREECMSGVARYARLDVTG